MEMRLEDMLDIVFYLADVDATGRIGDSELAEVLGRLNTGLQSQALSAAAKTIQAFAGINNTFLDKDHFNTFIEHLAGSMNSTIPTLCTLLISRLAFNQNGYEILERFTNTKYCAIEDDVLREARLFITFDMMDYQQTGWVSTRFVLKKLEGVIRDQSLSEDTNEQLEEGKSEMIDYPHFRMLNQKLAMLFRRDVFDLLNAITLAVARQDGAGIEIRDVLNESRVYNETFDFDTHPPLSIDKLKDGKILRMFDILDADHDGFIVIIELTLFMRKFQQSKDLDSTISQSIRLMIASDFNGDTRLDRNEFTQLLLGLSSISGIAIQRLLDFLLVESALTDDVQKEKEYVQQLKAN